MKRPRRMVVPLPVCLLALIFVLFPSPTVQLVGNEIPDFPSAKLNEKIEDMVMKHLKETEDSSPVHLVIGLKVDPIILDQLLTIYLLTRPTFLWSNNDHLTPICASNTSTKVSNIVGIFNDISDVKAIELRNFFGCSWNSRSKLAIWITGNVLPGVVEIALKDFWSFSCLNVAFIVLKPNATDLDIFSYNPFELCENKRGKILQYSSKDPLFPDKIKNLQRYPIAVSMFQDLPFVKMVDYRTLTGAKGTNLEAIRYLASWLNFTIDLKSADVALSGYTVRLSDGKTVGSIGDIIENRSEIVGNALLLKSIMDREELEFLKPFGRTSAKIVVRKAESIPSIVKIFRSFDGTLQILILISVGSLAVMMRIMGKRNSLLNAFRLLIFQEVRPISTWSSERIFFISWIIWAFILVSAYQAKFKKVLTDPSEYPGIKTLADLADSDVKIVLNQFHYDELNKSELPMRQELMKHAEIDSNFDVCMARLVAEDKVACVDERIVIKATHSPFNEKHKFANKQWKNIRTLKERLVSYWVSLAVKKGFPYLEKFDMGYQKILQFGLRTKWRGDARIINFERSERYHDDSLKLRHFNGIFCVYLIGITIAFVTFIGEIVFNYIKAKETSI